MDATVHAMLGYLKLTFLMTAIFESGRSRTFTWTSSGQVRKITLSSNRHTQFHLGVGSERVMQIDTDGSDVTKTVYAVTEESGQVEYRYLYDPWGKRILTEQMQVQSSSWQDALANPPTRGFTDHEHLDDFEVIH
ncbi:hypothetical protein MLD52_22505, partial [Puniceicoccaceae bacterium K14]|nr:hypothetical protein [Puniceicoccaceae bacterium K14]